MFKIKKSREKGSSLIFFIVTFLVVIMVVLFLKCKKDVLLILQLLISIVLFIATTLMSFYFLVKELAEREKLIMYLPENQLANVISKSGVFIRSLLNSHRYVLHADCTVKEERRTEQKVMNEEKRHQSSKRDVISSFFANNWLMEKMGLKGIKWIGLNKVQEYPFNVEIAQGGTEFKTYRNQISKFFYVKLENYRREFMDLDSKGMNNEIAIPLRLIVVARISIRNSYLAGCVLENWIEFTFTTILAYLRCIIASKTFDEVQKGIEQEELTTPVSGIDTKKGLITYLREYGIWLDKLELLDVNFMNPDDEKMYKKHWEAEQKGKASLTEAEFFKKEQVERAAGAKAYLDVINKYAEKTQEIEKIRQLGEALGKSKNENIFITLGEGENNSFPLLSKVGKIERALQKNNTNKE